MNEIEHKYVDKIEVSQSTCAYKNCPSKHDTRSLVQKVAFRFTNKKLLTNLPVQSNLS